MSLGKVKEGADSESGSAGPLDFPRCVIQR